MIIYNLATGKKVMFEIGNISKIPDGVEVDLIIRFQISLAYPGAGWQEEFAKFVLECVKSAIENGIRLERILKF